MTRKFFAALLSLGVFHCVAQDPTTSATSTATNTPAPSRETLAAASAGYLDLPQKSTYGYSSVYVDGPYIAMTFDDGPDPKLTPKLLDLLKAKGIKATFFVVGQNASEYPDVLKRAVAEGHEIGNHSWSHPNFGKMSDGGVSNELQKTQDAITQATGIKPKLLRPPYGSITKHEREWIHDKFGYKIILWDVDPLDWKYRNSTHVENEILKQTRKGSIILSHDIHATTVEAMPATFDALLAKGYKFVTVSELLALEKPATPTPAPSPGTKKKAD
ncbi:MAG: polysaccharide deacetylase family protein [Verrucomicrobiota bacterium]